MGAEVQMVERGERSKGAEEALLDAAAGDAEAPVFAKAAKRSKAYKRSIQSVLLIIFAGSLGFAIVLPSLWIYLKGMGSSKSFLGVVAAAYAMGQLSGSPVFGYWSNHANMRTVFIVSLFVTGVGNLFYSVAATKEQVLVARFICGFGAGNVAPARAFISHATAVHERTKMMTLMSACQALGFILGPSLAVVLAQIPRGGHGFLLWDKTTSAGYFSALLSFITIYTLKDFKDTNIKSSGGAGGRAEPLLAETDAAEAEAHAAAAAHAAEGGEAPSSDGGTPAAGDLAGMTPRRGVGTCLALFFVVISVFAVMETIGVPFTHECYGWGVTDNGYMFLGAGVVSVLSVSGMLFLTRRFDEKRVLLFYLTMLCSSYALMLDTERRCISKYRFLAGVFVCSNSYAPSMSLVYSSYSKVLGLRAQGFFMALLTATGSSARVIGPVWASVIFDHTDLGYVNLVCTSITACAAITLVFNWRYVVSYETFEARMRARKPSADAAAGSPYTVN